MPYDVLNRNHVTLSGSGARAMMFTHGFGCSQEMWRFVTPAFEKDYRIVLFDYVGSGRSDLGAYNPERYATLRGYAQDIIDICDALNLRDIVLVAHSVSGMVSLLAAIARPELFHCLILIGPSPHYMNDAAYPGGFEQGAIRDILGSMEKNYDDWAQFLAPMVMKNDKRPELAEELRNTFRASDPKITRQFAAVTFYSDHREDLPRLRVPSLIMQCMDDMVVPVGVGKYMHGRIPNSTFCLMRATGHYPQMSAPQETIDTITEYLASLPMSRR